MTKLPSYPGYPSRSGVIKVLMLVATCILLGDVQAIAQARKPDREQDAFIGQVRAINETGASLSGSPNSPVEGSRYRVRSRTYDMQGNTIEEILYGGIGGTDVVERRLSRYESDGIQISNSYMGGGIPDPNTNPPVLTGADKTNDGALITRSVYKYDSLGNVVECSVYRGGGAFLYRVSYKYDDRGRRIEWSTGSDKVSYSYEGNGTLPTSEIRSGGSKVTFKYELDSRGNWTKRTELFNGNASANIGQINYRTISYYDSPKDASNVQATPTTYYVVPAGLVPAVPYEVIAVSSAGQSPPPGVVAKTGVIVRGQVITRVQPSYPPLARPIHLSGVVQLEIVVDETGNVIYARATVGHPLLRESAEVAARQWKFAPTTVDGKPVKVLGGISMNFNP